MAALAFNSRRIALAYLKKLKRKMIIERAVIFGSAAAGNMTPDSDLDLIVISNYFKNMKFLKRLEFLSLMRGRDFLSIPMDILGYTPQEFDDLAKKRLAFSQILKKGRIISF